MCAKEAQAALVEEHRPQLERLLRLSDTLLEVVTTDVHRPGCLGKAFAGRGRGAFGSRPSQACACYVASHMPSVRSVTFCCAVLIPLEGDDAVRGNLQREIDKWTKRERKQRKIAERILERQSRSAYHQAPVEVRLSTCVNCLVRSVSMSGLD